MTTPTLVALPSTSEPESAVLHWHPPVERGRVQVSRDARFADLVADVPVSGDEVTLHDLGVAAGTLHWHVSADAGASWSDAAALTIGPDAAAAPRPTAARPRVSPTGVTLVSPVDGAPADARAATFTWDAATDDEVRVQVSRDRDFARPLVEIPTRAVSLTLHDTLPETGAAYYWRVGTAHGWTPPARFRPASDDAVSAWDAARAAAARAARATEERLRARGLNATAEATAPWRSAATTSRESAVLLYVMLVSFVVTLIVGFLAVP